MGRRVSMVRTVTAASALQGIRAGTAQWILTNVCLNRVRMEGHVMTFWPGSVVTVLRDTLELHVKGTSMSAC